MLSTREEGTSIDHAQAVVVRIPKIEGTLSPWLYYGRGVDPRLHPNRSLLDRFKVVNSKVDRFRIRLGIPWVGVLAWTKQGQDRAFTVDVVPSTGHAHSR